MAFKTNRRNFLRTTAVAGASTMIMSDLLANESPNEVVRFATVGIGGKGTSDSNDANRFGKVVAFCDTNRNQLKGGAKRFKDAKAYEDYRVMFDEMADQFDAVTVSTTDHMHAIIAATAMKHGKAVFCQKPLTRTISEARMLSTMAKEKNLVTQMGNQGVASTSTRESIALVRAGLVGTVKEVIVWTNRPIWPQGGERGQEAPVPAHLNWDAWLGNAPKRPYVPGAYDPFAWRGWWDFGSGALGDMACHTCSVPYFSLEMKNPSWVQATSSGHNFDSFPKWSEIHFEFPAVDWRPGFKLTWLDGGKKPDPAILGGLQPAASAFVIIGDKGTFYSPNDYGTQRILIGEAKDREEELLKKVREDLVTADQYGGHFGEFVQAIKDNKPLMPFSNMIDKSGGLTETILLGNLAVWAANEPEKLGEKVLWDAANIKILGNPADRARLESLVYPKYQNGYEI
ncbi:MAG: Gfo/Idh/MocA family oxidoreductase [Thermoguttaceae bacterium]|nr:Gfo/Idh/MocA family oxidoreductase [Thermoguttaceae bacterium]